MPDADRNHQEFFKIFMNSFTVSYCATYLHYLQNLFFKEEKTNKETTHIWSRTSTTSHI